MCEVPLQDRANSSPASEITSFEFDSFGVCISLKACVCRFIFKSGFVDQVERLGVRVGFKALVCEFARYVLI